MPTGIYKHKPLSESHKRNIKTACLGYKNHMFGKNLSKEHKDKISNTLSGHQCLEPTRQKIREALNGLYRSEESKIKQSKNRIKYKVGVGNRNSNWKGGITSENKRIKSSVEYFLWRESVFARDNYTCQKYKVKGGRLHPHHIKNFAEFPELRFIIDNGITLSDKAHIEFHKKYGYKNNTIDQLYEYLNS